MERRRKRRKGCGERGGCVCPASAHSASGARAALRHGWQIFNDFLHWIGSFAVPGTCLQFPNAIQVSKSIEDSSLALGIQSPGRPESVHRRLAVSGRPGRNSDTDGNGPFCRQFFRNDPAYQSRIELQCDAPIKKWKTGSAKANSAVSNRPRKTTGRSPPGLMRTQPMGTHAYFSV